MAVTGKPKIGKARKLYIDVDGDIAIPTWDEAGKIQGLTKSFSKNLAEIEERGEDDVLVMPGHNPREISFELTVRPGDAIYDALETAFETNAKVGAAIMSGDITNSGERGYQAEVYVTGWSDDEAHTNTAVSVTVRPAADYDTPPAFVEIV